MQWVGTSRELHVCDFGMGTCSNPGLASVHHTNTTMSVSGMSLRGTSEIDRVPIDIIDGPPGDLLLICSDGQSIRAHSQIIMLASSVLRQTLSSTLKVSTQNHSQRPVEARSHISQHEMCLKSNIRSGELKTYFGGKYW